MPCVDSEDFFTYLTYSERDLRWQIVCTDVGRNRIPGGLAYPPHHHPHPYSNVATGRILSEYQLVYITRGSGVFATAERSYDVTEGCAFMLFPGEFHRYSPDPDTGWDERWVGFRGAYPDKLVEEGILTSDQPLMEIGLDHHVVELFDRIVSIVRTQDPFFQARAGAAIVMLLAELATHPERSRQTQDSSRIVEQARFALEENVYGTVDLSELSEKLGISTSHLTSVFRSYTGMTPYQYFIWMKINKAKEYLGSPDMSVKQIALDLGFQDPYYFSRLFKRKTGISPARWRRRGG